MISNKTGQAVIEQTCSDVQEVENLFLQDPPVISIFDSGVYADYNKSSVLRSRLFPMLPHRPLIVPSQGGTTITREHLVSWLQNPFNAHFLMTGRSTKVRRAKTGFPAGVTVDWQRQGLGKYRTRKIIHLAALRSAHAVYRQSNYR